MGNGQASTPIRTSFSCRTAAPIPPFRPAAAQNWNTHGSPAPRPVKPARGTPAQKSPSSHWCPRISPPPPAPTPPPRAWQNVLRHCGPMPSLAPMTTPSTPTPSAQHLPRILFSRSWFAFSFSSLLAPFPAYFLRVEPEDWDGCDCWGGGDGRAAGAGAGADIVLRLSTPRTLDCRASDELSEPPNALPPDVLPPVCPRTSGAGRETLGGMLMVAPLLAKPGLCATGGVAPPRSSVENPGTVPGRLSRAPPTPRLPAIGAGAEGVARAARKCPPTIPGQHCAPPLPWTGQARARRPRRAVPPGSAAAGSPIARPRMSRPPRDHMMVAPVPIVPQPIPMGNPTPKEQYTPGL